MDKRFIEMLNYYFEKEIDQLENGENCSRLYDIMKRAEKGYNDEKQMKEDAIYIWKNREIHNRSLAILLLKSYKYNMLDKENE